MLRFVQMRLWQDWYSLKKEAACSVETSLSMYQSTGRIIRKIRIFCSEILRNFSSSSLVQMCCLIDTMLQCMEVLNLLYYISLNANSFRKYFKMYLILFTINCVKKWLFLSNLIIPNLTLRLLMSYIYIYIYIYGAPILDVSRSHTTTQHSR